MNVNDYLFSDGREQQKKKNFFFAKRKNWKNKKD